MPSAPAPHSPSLTPASSAASSPVNHGRESFATDEVAKQSTYFPTCPSPPFPVAGAPFAALEPVVTACFAGIISYSRTPVL